MKLGSMGARGQLRKLSAPKFLSLLAVLVAVLVITPWATIAPGTAATKAQIQFVAPDWVKAHAKDKNLRILDVRNSPLDYITSHVPNAINIADTVFRGPDGFLPVQYWDTAKLGDTLGKVGVNNQSHVLVYSDGRDVLGATMVAYLLERSGIQNIAVLDSGFAGYKGSGQAATKEFPRYSQQRFTVRDNPSIRVTLNDVKNLIGKPGVVFIDPRPGDLFRGEKDIWVRNGHIPGARNIPWPTFTEADNAQDALKNPHKLKSLDDIRKLLAEKGIKPTDDIIVSCSTGREATLQYVVLKHLLNYPKVRIYEGSWTEYSTTDLPVETGPEKPIKA
ncbi:sulfurtransferase [Alkalinema pantanalense CENA528]|uniref:sulfurtransferase n=1 Tax=Alkalinema pantanalense TaxID=1620705 RepID=UPI003D6F740C